MIPPGLFVAALLAGPPAGTKGPPRVEPVVSLDSAIGFSSTTLRQGGEVQREYVPLYHPLGMWAGVQVYYGRAHSFATGGWRGTFELGARTSTPVPGVPVGLAHSTLREWKVRPRLSLATGVRAAILLDAPALTFSQAELGIPLALSTRRIDLVYSPSITLPLGGDRDPVFDGEIRRGAALMVMPFHLRLRFKLGRGS